MNPRLVLAVACLVSLAGCAPMTKDRGFGCVRNVVAARAGLDVHWNQGTPAEAQVAERIRRVLSRSLAADDVVQVALLNNRRMQASYARLGIAQADLVEAGLLENPVFHVRPRWPDSPPTATNIELGVEWDFLQALMIPARKQLAGTRYEGVRLGVTHEVLTFVGQVREAYYTLVAAEQLANVMRVVAEAAEASYELAERMSEAGNVPELDLQNQRALYEEAKLEYARARLESLDARERLNALMGLWGDQTAWSVPAQLPEMPAIEASIVHLESAAIANRLDLMEAGREVEALSAALGITRNWRFLLFARIGIDSERDTSGQWLTGPELQVELPLFNQRQADIARLEAELQASEDRLTALAIEIRSEVRALRTRLLLTRQVVERYQAVIVPTYQRIVQLSQEQYNFMLIGIFHVLEARKEEMRTYRDYVNQVRDYWITRARLERAIGARLTENAGSADINIPAATDSDQGPASQQIPLKPEGSDP
ncbi:MAG: TolC family protein [Planctomycetes bacterium]|nr:TolC family protein [Planctomycetota bacterium]